MQDAGNATTVCARGQRMTTKLLHRTRLSDRHVEFVGVVLGMPAPLALDAHRDACGDVIGARRQVCRE
jgi:hypothetical protein